MASLAEKLRACAVLGGFGAVDVEDSDGDQREVLTLSGDDLKTIADALDPVADALEENDDANDQIEKLKAKLAERPTDSQPVAWWLAGPRPSATASAAEAQRHSDAGKHVAPLYVHPPASEALPTREDLEVVLRECLQAFDLVLGIGDLSIREDGGRYAICAWDEEVEDVEEFSFAEAIAKAAALLRGKKAEG